MKSHVSMVTRAEQRPVSMNGSVDQSFSAVIITEMIGIFSRCFGQIAWT